MALVARGIRADAGIVPEPTGFDVWVACRGSSYATIEVPGRPGHAEVAQPHWREGGAVNAIEKATLVLDEIRRLREDWRSRDDLRHPLLSPSDMVPTVIAAGEWPVTYPASCRLTCGVLYLPAQADADGWGSDVEEEVRERVLQAAQADDWLAEHPPTIAWSAGVMPMEIPADEPIVTTVLGASRDVGRPGGLAGLDSWYDGATFTRFAGTPSVAFGPGGLDGDRTVAHTIDEFVPVDDLVACAQAIALAAIRFCGLSG
jgi:acetylornithine deacetylase